MTNATPKAARASLTNEELAKLRVGDLANMNLSDDEQSRLRHINRQKAEERTIASAIRREEEAPILIDLQAVGINVCSVWDLVNEPRSYRDAIPILIDHVTRGYSDRTSEGIARALAVPESKGHWSVLERQYLKAPQGKEDGIRLGFKSGLAAALAAIASDDEIGLLASLALDRSNGESRLLLLNALRTSQNIVAKVTIEKLADDPDLRKEISSWERR